MNQNCISKILFESLTSCFNHHLEHTPAPNFPEQLSFADAEKEFVSTLSEEQQESYDQLVSSLLVALETKENEHYYRLGFHDGLAAWGSVR